MIQICYSNINNRVNWVFHIKERSFDIPERSAKQTFMIKMYFVFEVTILNSFIFLHKIYVIIYDSEAE